MKKNYNFLLDLFCEMTHERRTFETYNWLRSDERDLTDSNNFKTEKNSFSPKSFCLAL